MGKPSSRSAPPAPLAFTSGQYGQLDSPVDYSPSSPRSSKDKSYRPFSGDYSGMSYHPPTSSQRKDSSTSNKSSGSCAGYGSSRNAKPPSPTVNAHSYCGRHSSQWLFSGWDVFRRGKDASS